MGHYCLFIDESGDFGIPNPKVRPSREWIVSGILCPTKPDEVEAHPERAPPYWREARTVKHQHSALAFD